MKYLTFLILFLGLPLLAFAQTTTGAVNTDTSFVPLTNIPFLTETGNAFSLDSFLNGLYRISIGIAAVVAVLQIMRAGIMYMGSDSGFAEKKEAKNLIALSIGGLILVLSPVVVFSVINPEILNLKIGNIEKLRGTPPVLTEETRDATLFTDTNPDRTVPNALCDGQGGTAYFICRPKNDPNAAGRSVPISEACNAATETGVTVCRRNATTPAAGSCTAYGTPTASTAQTCDGSQGLRQIDRSCCSETLPSTSVCCGKRKITEELYAWKGEYYTDKTCVVTPGATCSTTMLKGGPYETQTQCKREFAASVPSTHSLKDSLLCSCDFNIGSQAAAFCPPN